MPRALVTGGTGFVGSHLVDFLVKNQFSVKCLVRKTSNKKWIKNLPVEYVTGSLLDISSLADAVKDVDYIFHLGGLTKAKKNRDYISVNYSGTRNLLEAAKEHSNNIKRFLYCSSQAAAGPSASKEPISESDNPNPVSIYGKSKLLGEEAVFEYKRYIPVTVVRPPAVYGPRDEDFLFVFKLIKKGINPILGTENKFYNFIYVLDLAKGLFDAAVNKNSIGQTFFICEENSYSWNEVVKLISEIQGKKVVKIKIPLPFLYIFASLSDLICRISGKPSIFNFQKVAELKEQYWICSSKKAIENFNFRPQYTLKEGLIETFEWYKKFGYL